MAAASAVYLLVLAAPLLGLDQIGTIDRHVHWDPLLAYEHVTDEPEGAYVGQEPDERIYYGAQELSAAEVAQARREAHPGDAAFYRYPTVDGGAVWFDAHGDDLAPSQRAELEALRAPPLEESSDSAALIVEEKVVNALLFVPIGIVAFAAFSPWWARLLAGPALSLTIEFAQWVLAAGRSAEIGDLIVNSAGAWLGVAMAATAAMGVEHSRFRGSEQ
ncbi:VanZ family protein [Salinactinospora qingdaonensis]|uniref:VanZ-like domain-containing protein n=1 Tax=Salinactinospora qingdaonensis TaxID=702744 RepID=A0ABP7GDF7_9ACTN